jgi:cobalt-zinc-cadmium efflux system membrane fusion protein
MVKNMIRNLILTISVILVILFIVRWQLQESHVHDEVTEHAHVEGDYLRGPHNGRLLENGDFAVEITIFETGVPPEFRIYAFYQGQPLQPSDVSLTIDLGRTGNVVDHFTFYEQGDFLRGDGVVTEPHSFDVTINAEYQGARYQWYYESYEGRTIIPEQYTREAGIGTDIAGPATILETQKLTGRVEIDPGRVSQIRPRFPGMVKRVNIELGDVVQAGDTLLTVESSESLQDYPVRAPISGLVIKRNVQAGEVTADEPLFTIVDLSHVWVVLNVFTNDIGKIKEGQSVSIETLDGQSITGKIDLLSPLSSYASQSIHTRVPLDNQDNQLRPGQFVRADVEIAEHQVPLAVRRSGVQRFRDFDVVYAKFGDTYEVRMLEFGITNDEWLEVVGGLSAGTEYVSENSYLIKADIEKSGASHDH